MRIITSIVLFLYIAHSHANGSFTAGGQALVGSMPGKLVDKLVVRLYTPTQLWNPYRHIDLDSMTIGQESTPVHIRPSARSLPNGIPSLVKPSRGPGLVSMSIVGHGSAKQVSSNVHVLSSRRKDEVWRPIPCISKLACKYRSSTDPTEELIGQGANMTNREVGSKFEVEKTMIMPVALEGAAVLHARKARDRITNIVACALLLVHRASRKLIMLLAGTALHGGETRHPNRDYLPGLVLRSGAAMSLARGSGAMLVMKAIALSVDYYLFLLYLRVLCAWFPTFPWDKKPWTWVNKITESFFEMCRGIMPPFMGTMDLSPMLGFFFLQAVKGILFYPLKKGLW